MSWRNAASRRKGACISRNHKLWASNRVYSRCVHMTLEPKDLRFLEISIHTNDLLLSKAVSTWHLTLIRRMLPHHSRTPQRLRNRRRNDHPRYNLKRHRRYPQYTLQSMTTFYTIASMPILALCTSDTFTAFPYTCTISWGIQHIKIGQSSSGVDQTRELEPTRHVCLHAIWF